MLYVAYGSNMNLEQMKFRCPKSKVLGVGILKGWKLVFNIHADILETKNQKDEVPVLVWDVPSEDFKTLDIYEGFPKYYIRKKVDVQYNGKTIKAIVYVMNNDRKGIALPFKQYYDTIKVGYIENKIPIDTLYYALKYTKKNETEYNQYKIKQKK